VAQLTDTIKYVLTERKAVDKSPIVVIVDFTLVVGMDSSAAHAVAKLKKIIHRLFHVDISIFVTGSGRGGFPCEYALSEALSSQVRTIAPTVDPPPMIESTTTTRGSVRRLSSRKRAAIKKLSEPLDGRVFESLDDALRFAEDILIYRTDPSLETLVDSHFEWEVARRGSVAAGSSMTDLTGNEENFRAKKYLRQLLPASDDLDKIVLLLLASMKREEYVKDQTLWETGMESEDMKLLICGELESIIEDTGATEMVNRGNIVGELGLVHGTKRLTTLVCASERAILYSLSRIEFEKLKKRKPQVAGAIDAVTIRYLAHRVQHVNNRYFHTTLPV
jgi:sulfate permease, SulP family